MMGLLASLDDRAYKGDLKGVQKLLAHGKDVNKPAATAGKVSDHNNSWEHKCDRMAGLTATLYLCRSIAALFMLPLLWAMGKLWRP